MRTKLFFSIIVLFIRLSLGAQPASALSWWEPATTPDFHPGGGGWHQDSSHFYCRLPADAEQKVRDDVFFFSRQSAGLTLHFTTDAPAITVEYTLQGPLQLPHMPATGVSGVDLYDGSGQRVVGTYQFADTVRYRFTGLRSVPAAHDAGYTLYLPLYNTLLRLRIGVTKGYSLAACRTTSHMQIAVYGTSITQGACASRPGLAWTSLLSRMSGYDVINLGFSGNGRLEPEVIGYLDQLNPAIYILDCLPNLVDRAPAEVTQKIVAAVRQIRNAHPATPVILTAHAGFGNERTSDTSRRRCSDVNGALYKALAILKEQQVKGLFLLDKESIGLDADCFVDQVHPNDAGMMRYARAYLRLIRQLRPARPVKPS